MNLKEIKTGRFWLSRATEVVTACLLFYVGLNLYEYREAVAKAEVPSEDWFEVSEIYVPDHVFGSNPDMLYDREIKVDHRGFWVVEVQQVMSGGEGGLFQNACTGSGVNDYDLTDFLAEDTVTWQWFVGRPCRVPPGTYRIQLTRDMMIPGQPIKKTRNFSNTFKVLESE